MISRCCYLLLVVITVADFCDGGVTSRFVRKLQESRDMPLDSDVFRAPPGYNAPQQVHITQGDHEGKGMIVSWVTVDEPGSSTVTYWTRNGQKRSAHGRITSYKYYTYQSGYIHHCTLKNLQHDMKYFYEVGTGGNTTRRFWFKTPPEVGDLGQTYDSNDTLTHYEKNSMGGQTLLVVGDLSYADRYPNHDNVRWDTWGRFVERSNAYQPWIWVTGNHEIDFAPEIGETKPFKPFTHRYHVPHRASNSTSPHWYSVKIASAYIIVLSSYSAYGEYTPQTLWLQDELPKVNRSQTPWLIVLMHSPWYNSYADHVMEGESMRVMYEWLLVRYKVDLVFAGHVHAYERSERISNIAYRVVYGGCRPVLDENAPVYITVGDGGNVEGLSKNMIEPQPEYSAYREASFGHATLSIRNRTHAFYNWHRNQDGYNIVADSVWFHNRIWTPYSEILPSLK
uniref:Purple acid phosphatase n=1 Tax=Kalanchoe fedtschenkoi TaxID=63787 RepID=A0A7N0ZS08_KALFE